MVDREKVFAICERVAEAQTLLNDTLRATPPKRSSQNYPHC
jgi:hypothetical protein